MAASNAKSKKPKEEDKKIQKLKEKQNTPTKKKKKKVDVKESSGNSSVKATKTAKTPEKKTTAHGKTKNPSKKTPRRDNEPKKTKAVANGKVPETDDAGGLLLSSSDSEEVANGGNKVKNQKGKSPKTEKRKRNEEGGDESRDDGEEKGEEKMCRFPMNRIKRIIKIENSDAAITQEATFLVNKATEKFLEKFADDGYKCCIKDNMKSLSYNHLSSVVSKQRRYQFLSDFVPVKVKAEDALKELKLTKGAE